MTLQDARGYINEVEGKSYRYLKEWGLSTIKEAIYTIWHRVSATDTDRERAERVSLEISRGYYKNKEA